MFRAVRCWTFSLRPRIRAAALRSSSEHISDQKGPPGKFTFSTPPFGTSAVKLVTLDRDRSQRTCIKDLLNRLRAHCARWSEVLLMHSVVSRCCCCRMPRIQIQIPCRLCGMGERYTRYAQPHRADSHSVIFNYVISTHY